MRVFILLSSYDYLMHIYIFDNAELTIVFVSLPACQQLLKPPTRARRIRGPLPPRANDYGREHHRVLHFCFGTRQSQQQPPTRCQPQPSSRHQVPKTQKTQPGVGQIDRSRNSK